METIIIMTEVTSPYGKYTKFTIKGDRKIIAEVDRATKARHGYSGYILYGNQSEIARHSNKNLVIEMAKEYILGFIPEAKFKFNVVSERVRLA